MWLELSPTVYKMHVKQSRENACPHTPWRLLVGPFLYDGDHFVGNSHLASGFRLGGESSSPPPGSEPPEGTGRIASTIPGAGYTKRAHVCDGGGQVRPLRTRELCEQVIDCWTLDHLTHATAATTHCCSCLHQNFPCYNGFRQWSIHISKRSTVCWGAHGLVEDGQD